MKSIIGLIHSKMILRISNKLMEVPFNNWKTNLKILSKLGSRKFKKKMKRVQMKMKIKINIKVNIL